LLLICPLILKTQAPPLAGGTYKLGFLSPGKSRNRYSGIWYGTISVLTPVWVANRETPLNDSSGVPRLGIPTNSSNGKEILSL